MKFLCDRCKTRYSIGDDRVRGKILKIRCKNCANVITVREGMSDADAADDAPATANGRVARPTTMAPKPAHTAAAPAAAPTNGVKPPPALDEEWYVSIDGEQSGPFSLTEAQRWIGAKPFDAELHCWSEGFDDWLPVDKVSHFRGVRKKPAPAAAPPPMPRQVSRPVVEDEPKPLFAATMASLERGAAEAASNRLGLPPAMPAAAMEARPAVKATPAAGVPLPRSNGNGAASGPAKGSGPGSAATPISTKAGGSTGPTATPAKLGNSTGPTATPAPTFGNAKPSPGTGPLVAKTAPAPAPAPTRPTGGRMSTQPGHTPAPAAAATIPGFDISPDELGDSATMVGAAPFGDDPPPPLFTPPTAQPKPLFNPPAPVMLAAAPAPVAPAPALAPAPPPARPPSMEDDGLDIAEVSRVVNLADLMRPQPKDCTGPARRVSGPLLTRTQSTPKVDQSSLQALGNGAALGQDAPLLTADAIADAALPALQPPQPPVQQRRSLVALLAVAVLLLGGVGAVVVIALSRNDDPVELGLGQTDQIDTTRPEDQIHHPFIPTPLTGSNTTIPHTGGTMTTGRTRTTRWCRTRRRAATARSRPIRSARRSRSSPTRSRTCRASSRPARRGAGSARCASSPTCRRTSRRCR